MKYVEPIRDLRKIVEMRHALRSGKQGNRNELMFVMGICAGLRISDLLRLTWGVVCDENGRPRDRIAIREKKTGKTKSWPTSAEVKELLDEYWPGLDGCQYLFPNKRYRRPISRVQAWRILHRAATICDIQGVGTHSMRKTFGYQARKAGTPIEIIQTMLNHSSPGVTLRYIGISEDELDAVYLSIASRLKSA